MKLQPVSYKTYCRDGKGKIRVIEKKQKRMVYEPSFFRKREGREHWCYSPEIYIAELSDVSVHGSSGIVISGNRAITDICENDTQNRVSYSFGGIRRGNKKLFYLEVSNEERTVDTAVSLCGLAAYNYYHLTMEILSKYKYVKDYIGDENIPVLLDEDARKYPQFAELISTVLGDAEIIYVREFGRISVNRLIVPSANIWMPINVRRKNDFRISDNLISELAVNSILSFVDRSRPDTLTEKVFISREKLSLERLTNEKEVIELFKNNGYRIVCPEELSYKEQVELFSRAKCVVGASGAAFANVIYCSPGAVIGCIIPEKYNFCIFSTLAKLVGCKTLFCDAKVIYPGITFSTDRYKADLSEIVDYIKALEELSL